ncbi:hypothetical protein JCM9492_04590 [Aquifex pyrophilus]
MRYLFIFFLLLISCSQETIYDINFFNLSGNPVKIKRENKKLLLYVWSGTCTGHTEDLRILNEVYKKLSERYNVVSVAVFMTPKDVRDFLKKEGINPRYPILSDPKGKLTEQVKLIFLPATLIFDESGKLLGNFPRLPLEKL